MTTSGAASASAGRYDDLIVHPAGPRDRDAIDSFVARLSPASRHMRFMQALRRLPTPLMDTLVRFEPAARATLVACRNSARDELVGIAQYDGAQGPGHCEVAVVVADAWKRKGVATLLLRELARVARIGGFHTVSAEILSDNHAAIELARRHQCSFSLIAGTPQMTRVSVSLDQVYPALSQRKPEAK